MQKCHIMTRLSSSTNYLPVSPARSIRQAAPFQLLPPPCEAFPEMCASSRMRVSLQRMEGVTIDKSLNQSALPGNRGSRLSRGWAWLLGCWYLHLRQQQKSSAVSYQRTGVQPYPHKHDPLTQELKISFQGPVCWFVLNAGLLVLTSAIRVYILLS